MSSNATDFVTDTNDAANDYRLLLEDVMAGMRVCMAELAETKQKLAKSEEDCAIFKEGLEDARETLTYQIGLKNEVETKLTEVESKLEEKEEKLAKSESELEENKVKLDAANEEVGEYYCKWIDTFPEIDGLKEKLTATKSELEEACMFLERSRNYADELQSKLFSTEDELEATNDKLTNLETESAKTAEELRTAISELEGVKAENSNLLMQRINARKVHDEHFARMKAEVAILTARD